MIRRTLLVAGLLPVLLACMAGAPAGSPPAPAPRSAVEGARLYVANQTASTISVIDIKSQTLIETLDLQKLGFTDKAKPHHIAAEPDGSAWYVSLVGDGYVVKFDRNNKVVGKSRFATPGMLALDPKSDLLYVTRSMTAVNAPASIGVIHRNTMADAEVVDVVLGRPHGAAADPRGTWSHIAGMVDNEIANVNGATGDVTLPQVPGDMMHMFVGVSMSPDGSRLVATTQMTDKVFIYDASGPGKLTLLKTLDSPGWPWDQAWTADGSEFWFGNQKANTVTVVNARTMEIADVIKGNGLAEPHGIAVSPDQKYVFVSNHNLQGVYTPTTPRPGGTGTVVVIDRKTHKIVKIIETDHDAVGMAVLNAQ
jgi:DNA-binding beta-propeller fold protein YncE